MESKNRYRQAVAMTNNHGINFLNGLMESISNLSQSVSSLEVHVKNIQDRVDKLQSEVEYLKNERRPPSSHVPSSGLSQYSHPLHSFHNHQYRHYQRHDHEHHSNIEACHSNCQHPPNNKSHEMEHGYLMNTFPKHSNMNVNQKPQRMQGAHPPSDVTTSTIQSNHREIEFYKGNHPHGASLVSPPTHGVPHLSGSSVKQKDKETSSQHVETIRKDIVIWVHDNTDECKTTKNEILKKVKKDITFVIKPFDLSQFEGKKQEELLMFVHFNICTTRMGDWGILKKIDNEFENGIGEIKKIHCFFVTLNVINAGKDDWIAIETDKTGKGRIQFHFFTFGIYAVNHELVINEQNQKELTRLKDTIKSISSDE